MALHPGGPWPGCVERRQRRDRGARPVRSLHAPGEDASPVVTNTAQYLPGNTGGFCATH
nr:hypothetical protein [Escherichia coli]EFJ4032724.1 hypothetical protein [Escherichia coli]